MPRTSAQDEGCFEVTFRLIVNNFSKLRGTVLSEPTFIRNLPWKIMVMKRLTYDEDIQIIKSLGFFLQCNEEMKTWSCSAAAVFKLISQKEGVESFTRNIQHIFSNTENDFGFSCFKKWEEILNPENGFIKYDVVILEVSVTADPPLGTKCCLISQTLRDMFCEGYLSDFNLKVGDKTFPAHKAILGMRSKVFRAMFDSEMKEMQDNCVDIKDMDGDTLQRMLQFIYSDRLDKNMDWIEASRLYVAADYYALEPLRQGCSTILKRGLSTTSALGVLYIADLHQDQQLKSAALDFISLNDRNIIGTEEWVKFEKENSSSALESMRELYLRKMNG